LGPDTLATQLDLFVYNITGQQVGSAAIRLFVADDPTLGIVGGTHPSAEFVVSSKSLSYQNVAGFQARTADGSQPVLIAAQLWEKSDPVPVANVDIQGTAAANGTITPPAGGAVVITGIIAANGTITAGSGFSVVHNSAGDYTVTFATAFASAPVVVATVIDGGATNVIGLSIQSAPTTNSFRVLIANPPNTALTDHAWNFLAYTTA
jgi:hypothetical protein